jgi:2-oxoglutarate/2-oxoacid ferredoxin oxidoreductase subunit beta
MSTETLTPSPPLTKKDFVPPNEVRWCPGCGDYAILNSIQKTFPELGVPREKFVVISGIGCSSRFPYYMQTYGFHTIHGRAPTLATGVKVANPDLSVWMITGDGDGLSIGGNHLLHVLRRNPNINILLFNNRVYGLTKGQYSPTSDVGMKTKSTPMGSIDHPVNPIQFAIGAEASFIARTVDTDPKHMVETFKAAHAHKGISFVEILQNCVIYNKDVWEDVYGRESRAEQILYLADGQPLIYGKDKDKGIRLNNLTPEIVTLGESGVSEADLLMHNPQEANTLYTTLLSQLVHPQFPTPIGVFRALERPVYEDSLQEQIDAAQEAKGQGDLQSTLFGGGSWVVE